MADAVLVVTMEKYAMACSLTPPNSSECAHGCALACSLEIRKK